MIIVPIEENHEGIGGLTDKKFKAGDYSGSGLEVLGKGLATLGDGGQQLATALAEKKKRDLAATKLDDDQRALVAAAIAAAKLDDNHQRNLDDAAAKNAYVGYSNQAASKLYGDDGLLNQSGVNAHVAFPATIAALADAHDQALAPLDAVQRGVIAPILADRLNGDVDVAATHVQQQGAAEQAMQSLKVQDAAARDAVTHADDPDLFDHHLMTGVKAISQQGKINGQDNKDTERQVADYTSGVHADTIDALIPGDPVKAAGWYARFGSNLNPVDKNRVQATLGPALVGARAVADVDAASNANPTAVPANPHAGDDTTTLLKMQGITPMMDQTALPALMQHYGNDPAKAWAAFEAGPDYLDRLIAQRGDDWYTGLDDDTRRFVSGNMHMLGAASSARTVPDDPQATAARIAAQLWEAPRVVVALGELDRRAPQPDAVDDMSHTGSPLTVRGNGPYGSYRNIAYQSVGSDPSSVSESDMTGGEDASSGETTDSGSTPQETPAASGAPTAKPAKARQRVIPQATIDRNRAQAETDLQNPYFRALMTLIGRYEGPDNPNFGNGYHTINGHLKKGDGLKDLSRFPGDVGNTAVGRYQIQRDGLWSYAAPALGVTGFTPHDQDLLAAYAIRRRHMYDSLQAGDMKTAASRINKIWAAFPLKDDPSGRYGQAHVSYDDFVRAFATELASAQASPVPSSNRYLQKSDDPYLRKTPMRLLENYLLGGK